MLTRAIQVAAVELRRKNETEAELTVKVNFDDRQAAKDLGDSFNGLEQVRVWSSDLGKDADVSRWRPAHWLHTNRQVDHDAAQRSKKKIDRHEMVATLPASVLDDPSFQVAAIALTNVQNADAQIYEQNFKPGHRQFVDRDSAGRFLQVDGDKKVRDVASLKSHAKELVALFGDRSVKELRAMFGDRSVTAIRNLGVAARAAVLATIKIDATSAVVAGATSLAPTVGAPLA